MKILLKKRFVGPVISVRDLLEKLHNHKNVLLKKKKKKMEEEGNADVPISSVPKWVLNKKIKNKK